MKSTDVYQLREGEYEVNWCVSIKGGGSVKSTDVYLRKEGRSIKEGDGRGTKWKWTKGYGEWGFIAKGDYHKKGAKLYHTKRGKTISYKKELNLIIQKGAKLYHTKRAKLYYTKMNETIKCKTYINV